MSPRFVDPPTSMFRRRPLIDPGLIALGGAIVGVAFIFLTVAMVERGFGVRLADVLRFAVVR